MRHRLRPTPPWPLWPLLALAAMLPAHGAPLADPTRPPGATAPADGPPPARRTGAPSRATAPASGAAAAASAPELQSLHLPRQGAPSALVDGRLLRVGDRLAWQGAERTVIAIDAQGIVLQPDGRARAPQRLWLLSGIALQPTQAAPTTPPLAVAARTKP